MAPRPAGLEGKTVRVIDQGYPNSDKLMMDVTAWFERNMPKAKAVFRRMGRAAVHRARLLTYLKLRGRSIGFHLNWKVTRIEHGIQRMIRVNEVTNASNQVRGGFGWVFVHSLRSI